jgi:hypothetical protein
LECRTNGRGWVGERTLAELQTLDVGYGYTADDGRSFPLRGKGVGLMPTLDEALKTHPGSRFLIQFKDGNPAVGDLMAAYLEQRDFVQWDRLTFFGAAGPLSRLKRLKPEARVWSAGATARCLVGYLALGWMGQVPKACDGGVIMIPISQSGFIWGWPDRFLERMHVHKTDHFAPDNTFEISMSSHGLDGKSAQAVWKPFFEWITASPNDYAITDEFGASGHEARHMWDTEGNPSMTLDPRVGAPKHHGWWKGDQGQVGAFLNGYDSLWLPEWLLHEDHGRRVGDALFAASRHKKIELHFNKGLAGATSDAVAATLGTATNPAVTEAFALAIIADGQKSAYPGEPRAAVDLEAARKDARAIDLAAAELRKIAPNAGSYVSESNFFNRNWQRDYWGKNYSRLQAIKTKYDPDGLFFVHHGVGSEDWSADGFTRL